MDAVYQYVDVLHVKAREGIRSDTIDMMQTDKNSEGLGSIKASQTH